MTALSTEIIPSVLPADHARMGAVCEELQQAGVDRIQWDVMDGRFVPNLTFGPQLIKACRSWVDVPFEAHLMIADPQRYLEEYASAGCKWLIVHVESTRHPHRALMAARELGCKAGLALNPGTPITAAHDLVELCDMLLLMTVNPGFGGQSYLPSVERKVSAARELVVRSGRAIHIEVDGGIGPDTITGAAGAGANLFVSGSALWRYASFAEGVTDLRRRASKGRDDAATGGPDRA